MKTEVLQFLELDSTSTYLRNYIKDNYHSIDLDSLICVISDTQTKGRGTSGKTWQSPKGNLYLSFCVKINTPLSDLRFISLDMGNLTISFLKEYYGIGLYQKWPNDIYFNSSKLCGILSESFKIEDNNFLLIGIGINVNNIDTLNLNSLKVNPISLSKILNHQIDLKEFKTDFINYLQNNIENIISNTHNINNDIDINVDVDTNKYPYFYPKNYPFLSLKDNSIYYIDYSSSYSELFLKKDPSFLKDIDPKILSSDENIIPLYSKPYPFISMDIGNSRVKIFLYKTANEPTPYLYKTFDIDDGLDSSFSSFINDLSSFIDSFIKDINPLVSYLKYPIHTISVSDKNYDLISSNIKSSSFILIPTSKRSVYLKPSYPSLGQDRCAIMEACIKTYPNSNIAVFSLGTATTLDIIQKDRAHLGGFILPGINSSLSILSKSCYNLPDLNIDSDFYLSFKDKKLPSFIGKDTPSCIINGALYNLISFIQNISSNFLSSNDTLVLTGGWSTFIFNLLNSLNKDNKLVSSDIKVIHNEYLSGLGTKIMTVNG